LTNPLHLDFPHSWQAEILAHRPLILPPRSFTYPHEAEEVERGALHAMVKPASAVPTGLWSCPHPDELCAVSGGYAFVVSTLDPGRFTQIAFRPVLEVRPLPDHNLLLFTGHYALLAWGASGLAWQTERLSSEGLRITEIRGHELFGFGWDLLTDREVPFVVDLETGRHSGPHSDSTR